MLLPKISLQKDSDAKVWALVNHNFLALLFEKRMARINAL